VIRPVMGPKRSSVRLLNAQSPSQRSSHQSPDKTLSTSWPKQLTRTVLMRLSSVLLLVCLNLTPGFALAASLSTLCLNTEIRILTTQASGRIGICVSDGQKGTSLNGGEQFPLYNVVQLPVAVAVLAAVDSGQIHLADQVTSEPHDSGAGGQPPAKAAGQNGPKTTIRDLLIRMIADNDGTAADSLITSLGGPRVIESVLTKKGIHGFRIDRDELDPRSFASSHHNTATPIAVANLLQWLVNGWLLSPSSSSFLLETMSRTRAFPDRLKAGLPNGWLLAHKPGTGNTTKGVTIATNDVGVLIAPDAKSFVVAVVLISSSNASGRDQANLIASVARTVGNCFQ
jgi:beta-lactamase class A